MSKWRRVPIGDLAVVRSGFAFKSKDWRPAGIPVVKIQNVRAGRVDLERCSFVSEAVAKEASRYGLTAGDVLITMSGEIGSIGVFRDEPALLNQRVGRVEVIDDVGIEPQFLAYALQHPRVKAGFEAAAYGVAQANISPSLIAQVEIDVPDVESQRAIAAVLTPLDALIENNRRRITLLEQMAQAIYREWFVRLRYPGYEDDDLVDSPLGPIPASWQVQSVEKLATVVRGRSYRKHELVEEGGVPFINLKCMARGGGFRREGLKRYAGPFRPEQVTSAGDIVLAVTDLTQSREILARATLVPRMPEESGVISLDVVRLVPRTAEERIPLFAVLRYSDLADRVKEHANGSTVLHLSPDHVAAAPIIWPSEPVRKRAAAVLGPIYSLSDALSDAADRLAKIRDMLLPKLVTGAIDVSQLDLDTLREESAA